MKVAFGSEVLEAQPVLRWGVGFLVIVGFTILNLLGTRAVGKASTLLAVLIIAPFLVLGAVAAFRYAGDPRTLNFAFLPEGGSLTTALAGGLGIAMWNYLGWDSLSTIAEEVEEPQKAYPLALVWGVPLVTAVYVIAVLAGLPFFSVAADWQEGVWPTIAQAVGGAPMFWLISVGAALSSMALFTATFLGASRLPFVMAQDRWLPQWLVTLHPRWGTPSASILLCASIYSVLSAVFSWQELIAINVVLYATALVMEGISLVIFRIREPDMARPFRIPGGLGVAVMFCVVPTAMILTLITVSIMEGGWMQVVPTGIALASGPLVLGAILLVRRIAGSSAGEKETKG
jgi:amino acid transporter